MTKILHIVTGSIAAYKALDLMRLFIKDKIEILPVMTKAAKEFITPLQVSALTGGKIYEDLFSLKDESEMGHIALSRQSDAIIVAPASADFIAKMANGIGDDLALATILASNKTIFVAPAMNEKMWQKSATQKNLQILRENGVKIIDPESDTLACGEYGIGKMANIERIFAEVKDFLNMKKIFSGKKVVISAGATYEPIDPVRFIGNYSSGKQGVAIAEIFADLGAEILLVAGNISLNINLPQKNSK